MDFRTTMLTKPPYPSFSQFVLALQGHEQVVLVYKEEEKTYLEHAQAYFIQKGHGRNGRGRRGNFNSHGRGFTPAGRYNSQNGEQNSHPNTGSSNNIQGQH
ncbi:hypothetical protein Ddye_032246 [Dipteronia dyeriana]|uniref:Uncharacterized protein n=1 Tax=Dipteronia dyeriana TaxID=168575 RepID=A0AAD9WN19_9ROSI|nr:hypothetical protein Ddye_032246 [Dipteronia dyeriana]